MRQPPSHFLVQLFLPRPVAEPIAYVMAPVPFLPLRLRSETPPCPRRPWLTLPRVAVFGWLLGFAGTLWLLRDAAPPRRSGPTLPLMVANPEQTTPGRFTIAFWRPGPQREKTHTR